MLLINNQINKNYNKAQMEWRHLKNMEEYLYNYNQCENNHLFSITDMHGALTLLSNYNLMM